MNRQDIIRFYENKIDDIADENVREDMFKRLQKMEDMMIELDIDIARELDFQENHIEDEIEDDYEYYRRVVNQ